MTVTPAPADTDRPAGRAGPIRVMYLIDSLRPGGAEHLLAAYLRHLPAMGIDPQVIAVQERDGNPVADAIRGTGIPVRTLGIDRLRRPSAYRMVADAVSAARPDLIHTQLEFANILGAAAAARLGVPVVSTLHTLETPAGMSRAAIRLRLMAWSLRRHADLVIAVSEHARRHHAAHLRIDGTRIITIHNGIEVARFKLPTSVGAAARRELGIPPGARVAVTVAVLRPQKAIDRLISAMPVVLRAEPAAHLLVVGDGSERSRLERQAAETGVDRKVTFAGNRADVPSMLSAADVFALPSLTEALPTVVAEAMAAGLPVVATPVGGTPEMVDPSTGVLVPTDDGAALADAVSGLLADRRRAAEMGRAGAAVAAERFEITTQAGRLAMEYERLLAARAGA